jgi:hypothetical protein
MKRNLVELAKVQEKNRQNFLKMLIFTLNVTRPFRFCIVNIFKKGKAIWLEIDVLFFSSRLLYVVKK